MRHSATIGIAVTALIVAVAVVSVSVAQHNMPGSSGMHRGGPLPAGSSKDPSDAFVLAMGGRIYDKWWQAVGSRKPSTTHPAYPGFAKKSGAATWRCKECHGWDYRGKDGKYAQGAHATGIRGIRGAQGWDVLKITKVLRAEPHGYTPAMIGDEALQRLAAFVARGQHDVGKYIDFRTGDVSIADMKPEALLERGRDVFQTICAVCHGLDGTLFNFGSEEKPSFIGTEATANPWEVLHKIRNGHPGAAMINLRAFPIEDAVAVLGYARTLRVK